MPEETLPSLPPSNRALATYRLFSQGPEHFYKRAYRYNSLSPPVPPYVLLHLKTLPCRDYRPTSIPGLCLS